jgi:CheY-like chemotaxis protein
MKKNILFADDDDVFRFTIGEYFADHPSLTFDMAENGVIALDKALAKQYDVILLDINMPFMKGNEAVKLIRNKWPTIKIFAFTGQTTPDKIKEFINDGFNGVIPKPMELKLLEGKLADILTSPTSHPVSSVPPSASGISSISSKSIPLSSTQKISPSPSPVLHPASVSIPLSGAQPKDKPPLVTDLEATQPNEKIELPAALLIKRIHQLEKEKEDLLNEIKKLKSELRTQPGSETQQTKNGEDNVPTFEIE